MRQRVQSRKRVAHNFALPPGPWQGKSHATGAWAKDTSMVSRDRQLNFQLDVDNTLLDNDALKECLAAQLRQALGDDGAARFWALYEAVRRERDVVDLPLPPPRYAVETAR